MIGKKIAHYEVTDKIGAGGMGEVYRARDTKLGRDVALKFLPEVFAADADRLGRFEREAKLLASLNHPNIASIYGIENDGKAQVLVLELVEGEDLSERLARGKMPLDEVLNTALQVTFALEAAHEQGVIHRDLKPANIKVAPSGAVKVLDFGLAKALDTDADAPGNLSHSPTILGGSSPTMQGVILGTAAYMSPEQARGKQVDKRADVFAFGCVLFEMLTGGQAFGGETISDSLASVLAREPDLNQLPEPTPRALRRLLERCLDKDVTQRLRDIGEARIAVDAIRTGAADEPEAVAAAETPSGGRSLLPWILVGVFAIAAAAAWFLKPGEEVAPVEAPPLIRSELSSPPDAPFELSSLHPGPATISPQGKHVTFSARGEDGRDLLWVRSLTDEAARPLSGTDGAGYPFWSPDGRTIGFFAQGNLKKVDITGSPPLTLATARVGKGGSWNADGMIVFAPTFNGPICRVRAAGGEVDTITALNRGASENSHRFPSFLPDGDHFLYFVRTSAQGVNESSIWVSAVEDTVNKRLFTCRSQAEYASEHIIYVRDNALMARPFDAVALEFTGDPFAVATPVKFLAPASRGIFSASNTGELVFLRGSIDPGARLIWADREGKELSQLGDRANYDQPRLSPDEKSVVVEVVDPQTAAVDLWIFDVERGIRSRFTFGPATTSSMPTWSPDGETIAFRRELNAVVDIYGKAFAGTDTAYSILGGEGVDQPTDWSSDGRYIALGRFGAGAGDIFVLTLDEDAAPTPFAATEFNEFHAAFSPDGNWIAYGSTESGRSELYVAPFPGPGRKWQISTNGGFWPQWRGDGRELFYQTQNNNLMSVDIDYVRDSIAIGQERVLFDLASGADFDVTDDGQRFLLVREDSQIDEPLTLILNWTELIPE